MDQQVAADALRASEHLKQDLHDHTSLTRIIDDIETEKQKLTPGQYKEYLAELNKDLKDVLPGLTIEGTTTQNGKANLVVKDSDSTSYLDKDEEKRLEYLEKNRTVVTQLPDGTVHEKHADGTTVDHKDNGDGNWTVTKTGPNPGDNFTSQHWADGTQLTKYKDGRGTSTKTAPDGSFKEHGWGPKPEDNYDSQQTKDGHFKITYANGHGMESYTDANGHQVQRKF